jgi:hypothetical protein
MKSLHIAFVVTLLSASLAFAQAPATTQATYDGDSPKNALRAMARAMADGNAEQIRRFVYAGSPVEEKMRSALADFTAGITKLRFQLEKTFSAKEARQLTGDMVGALEDNSKRIDGAAENITGETATVEMNDPNEPKKTTVRLRKTGNDWQIVMLDDNGKPVDDKLMESRADELAARAHALADTADDVAQGKLQTIQQVIQSVEAKMMATLSKRAGAPSNGGR